MYNKCILFIFMNTNAICFFFAGKTKDHIYHTKYGLEYRNTKRR